MYFGGQVPTFWWTGTHILRDMSFPPLSSGFKTEAAASSKILHGVTETPEHPVLIPYASCSPLSFMKFIKYCVFKFRDFDGFVVFVLLWMT